MKKILHAAILAVVLFGISAVPALADGAIPIPPHAQIAQK